MYATTWKGAGIGILIGLGIGVGVGMLLAPKPGAETRDQIVENLKDGLDQAVSKGQHVRRRVQKQVENTGERVRQLAEIAKSSVS
jgi:gas vesicle protein